jgi:hypothetical protein
VAQKSAFPLDNFSPKVTKFIFTIGYVLEWGRGTSVMLNMYANYAEFADCLSPLD